MAACATYCNTAIAQSPADPLLCGTHAEASAPCYPCTAEHERQFTLGEADTLKPKGLSSHMQYLGYFSCVIFVPLGRTDKVETQTHDITSRFFFYFNRAR